MDNTSRRKFLISCIGGIFAAAAGAILYPLYRYLAPRKSADAGARITILESEVPPGGAKFFKYNGEPGVMVRKRDGELVALSAVCTHLGCIIQWQADKQDFLCPCHAGRFTADGAVVAGPPPRPLDKLAFSVADGTITIG